MFDLITIGDITMDLYFSGHDLTINKDRFYLACGAKYSAEIFHDSLGGGAANVAINASNLNLNAAIVAKIGEHSFKQIMLQKLIKKRVSTEFIIYEKNYYNLSAILVNSKGERTVIHYVTPQTELNLTSLQIANLTNTKSVYIGHLPGIPLEQRLKIIKTFKNAGIPVFMNIGIDDTEKYPKTILDYITYGDILIINRYEFARLIKKDHNKLDLKKNFSNILQYQNKPLIITDGVNGSYGYFQSQIFYQPIIKSERIVDTNGVGDGYTTGFIQNYLTTKNIQESMLAGSKIASKIISKVGTN